MTPSRPRDRGDFEIALICALKIEADAVHTVFDKFWEDEGARFGQAPGDDNAYTTGVISGHNVVLAYTRGIGKLSASAVSFGLRTSFPSIKLALVVGVCGGVPYGAKKGTRIYLGDLIISTALVQYDFGPQYPAGHKRKDTLEDTLGRASPRIRPFLNKLETKRYRQGLQKNINATLEAITQQDPEMSCPGVEKHVLYKPEYFHQHRPSSIDDTCSTCDRTSGLICSAALQLSCQDLGCEAIMLDHSHSSIASRQSCSPVIHFGRMGSGDTILKSGLHRDSLAQRDSVIGLEMEGAGIWDQLPSIVIKSVCDYADSHKNKDWQAYAAAVAAAGVKAFLMEWNVSDHLLAYSQLRTEHGLPTHSGMEGQHSISVDDEKISCKISHRGVQHLPSGKRRRINESESNFNDGNDDAILATLSFQGMSERRNNVETHHRKTCQWILDLEEYRNWQSQQSGLLWIKGKPGAGKSTLMLFLYNTLCRERSPDGGVHLDFFFSARGNELQRIPLGMLRSLLNQLFRQDSRIRDVIRRSFSEKETTFGGAKHSWTWQRRELEALLIEAITLSAQQQQVTIFIDALDEAGERVAREMAQYFHDMHERIAESSGSVKICISCRHYPIVSRLRGIEVCVEEHNRADITAFVYDRLHIQDTRTRGLSLVDSWHSLANDLVKQAHGVFQWVYLVLPIIEKSHDDGESLGVCRQRLRTVPEGLEDVYQHIIRNVINKQDRDRSFHLFQWVCLAERPLSITEMRFAMATKDVVASSAQVRCNDTARFVKADELMERQIRALSGGLVEVVHDEERSTRVQVIHQSVNDFLLSQGLALLDSLTSTLTPPPTLDVVRLCQENLYHCCLNYLATEDSNLVIHDVSPSKFCVGPGERFPLAIYATVNLLVHAEKSVGQRMKNIEEEVGLLGQVFSYWVAIYRALVGDFPGQPHAGTSILHASAAANLIDVVKYLMRSNTEIDAQDQKGYTALHLAAHRGHLSMVELLVHAGFDPQLTTQREKTPLVLAAGSGHLELVEWFVNQDANIKTPVCTLDGPLQAAAAAGCVMIVRYLIGVGADVNAQGGYYGTALQAASIKGNKMVVQMLLRAGADVNAHGGGYHDTALAIASGMGHQEVVQILLKAGVDVNVNIKGGSYGTALQAASYLGDLWVVEILLEVGADVNIQGGYYGTALQAASFRGHEDVVEKLLKAGADVNIQGGHYGTALQAASYLGDLWVVEILLEAGADVNIQGGYYGTALQAASRYGGKVIVQMLLEAEVDVNVEVTFEVQGRYRGDIWQPWQLVPRTGTGPHGLKTFYIRIVRMLLDARAK